MRMTKTLMVPAVVSVLVLSAGSLVSAASKTTPATPAAATPKPKRLIVTGTNSPVLTPGSGPKTVWVSLSNPSASTGVVTVTRVSVTGAAKRGSTPVPTCVVRTAPTSLAHDVRLTGYVKPATGPAVTLQRNDTKLVPVTVEMLETGVNQNQCKGVTIALNFSVTAEGR